MNVKMRRHEWTNWRKLAVGVVGAAAVATGSLTALDSGNLAIVLASAVILGCGAAYVSSRLDNGPGRGIVGNATLLGLLAVIFGNQADFVLEGALVTAFILSFFASLVVFQIRAVRAE